MQVISYKIDLIMSILYYIYRNKMSERFNKFNKSNLFTNFSFVFEEGNLTDLDYYNHSLKELRVSFNCNYLPTEDQIIFYINNEEDIDEKDTQEFILFVRVIFEKLHNILSTLNKKKKNTEQEEVKLRIQEEKKRIREEKRLEKLEQKIKEANRVCICNCGKQFSHSNRIKHINTKNHQERLDAIEYYIASRKLDTEVS